jgi:hypothetical protein
LRSGQLDGGLGFVGEDAGEVGAVGIDEDDFEQGGEEAHADAVAAHKKRVEDQDVDEYGAEDAEAERCGASYQDEEAAEDLEEADVMHPACGHHDGVELCDGGTGRGCRHRQEGMEDIGAEDDEHEAEQDATDEGDDLHGGEHS